MIAASITIPWFNQLDFTRHWQRALFRYTRPAWEPIVVANGASDGTRSDLARVQDASPVPVRIISNAADRGNE